MTSRILVADDSPTIQKIVALAFENEDIEVQGVGNGQEAWKRVEEYQPDIVLADVDLPGLSGFDLSRKIKSSEKHQGRWVILLSSDFEEFDEEAFHKCAAEDHLSKPFKTEDIIQKVQKMLSGDGIPNSLEIVEEAETPAVTLSANDLEGNESPVVELSAGNMMEEDDSPDTQELELSADDLIDELLEEKPAGDNEDEALTAEETGAPEQEEEEEPEMLIADMDEETELETVALADKPEAPAPDPADEGESVYTYLLTDDQMSAFDESRVPDEDFSLSDTAPVEPEPQSPAAEIATALDDDETSPDFILGELQPDPDPVEDLENAFRAVTGTKKETTPETPPAKPQAPLNASTPDLIKESRAFLAGKTGRLENETATPERAVPLGLTEENLSEAMVQHAARVLEAGLDRNLKRELAGISDQVNRVVREVVQEMAPDIIREVIRQEIQNIRKMEEV